jgi:hypothetical protein
MKQLRRIHRPPRPVGAADLVDHQRVSVQLRVARTAGAVVEQGHRQAVRLDLFDAVRAPPGQACVRVEVGQTGFDRGPVRPHRRHRHVGISQCP